MILTEDCSFSSQRAAQGLGPGAFWGGSPPCSVPRATSGLPSSPPWVRASPIGATASVSQHGSGQTLPFGFTLSLALQDGSAPPKVLTQPSPSAKAAGGCTTPSSPLTPWGKFSPFQASFPPRLPTRSSLWEGAPVLPTAGLGGALGVCVGGGVPPVHNPRLP